MAEQTQQRDVEARSPVAPGRGENTGVASTADPRPPRRPYASPELRYLGKVAELTFGTVASISDGGTHTGHNQKV
jgi:hypothetical protein